MDVAVADAPISEKLPMWERYLAWVRQHYPTGGKDSGLIGLYERATKDLQAAGVPACPRVVRIWLDYAGMLTDPLDVFHFMDHNGIGRTDPRFYLAWAACLEHLGRIREAATVLGSGLDRGARPDARLRMFLAALLNPSVSRVREASPDENSSPACSLTNTPSVHRTPLRPHSPQPPNFCAASPCGNALLPRFSSTPFSTPQGGNKRPVLSVYEGDGPCGSHSTGKAPSWTVMASDRDRRKENVAPALRWSETTVPCSLPYRPSAFTLQVFEDPEDSVGDAAEGTPMAL